MGPLLSALLVPTTLGKNVLYNIISEYVCVSAISNFSKLKFCFFIS